MLCTNEKGSLVATQYSLSKTKIENTTMHKICKITEHGWKYQVTTIRRACQLTGKFKTVKNVTKYFRGKLQI